MQMGGVHLTPLISRWLRKTTKRGAGGKSARPTLSPAKNLIMELYNVFYFDIQINAKPLTLRRAQNLQNSCVINYGYRPEIIPIQEPETTSK